jgi:ATP synthase protein I
MSNSGPDPERLRELGAKLDEVRQRETEKRKDTPRSPAGIVMRLSTELVAAPLVGAAIGFGLDWVFGTRPVLTLVVFVLGAITGVRNVMRTAKELNAPSAPKDGD